MEVPAGGVFETVQEVLQAEDHGQTARRVILSRQFGLAEIGKSEIDFASARLTTRDVRPIVARREAGCDGRGRRAQTKRAGSVRQSRVVPTPRRWCEPLRAQARGTVAKTPGTPRRARYKSSNIAQGMPECVRLYLLTTRVRFLRMHCTRERGCNGTRHSLRPHDRSRANDLQTPGKSCRGNDGVRLVVIARSVGDEAARWAKRTQSADLPQMTEQACPPFRTELLQDGGHGATAPLPILHLAIDDVAKSRARRGHPLHRETI
jgi:hypothetical protein